MCYAPPFWEQAVVTACWLSVCTTLLGVGGGYRLLALYCYCMHATRPYCSSSAKSLFANLPIGAMAAVARPRRVFMEAARVMPDWKVEDLLALAMYPFV